mgnify:CR=1 FL=1
MSESEILQSINNFHLNKMKNVLEEISSSYDIDFNELANKFLSDNHFKNTKEPRKKQKITEEQQCQAIKQDGQRCTRRHKPGCKYCGKHEKTNNEKEKDDYIATKREMINGIEYLVDKDNIVYRDNIENPEIIGKKIIENNNGTEEVSISFIKEI